MKQDIKRFYLKSTILVDIWHSLFDEKWQIAFSFILFQLKMRNNEPVNKINFTAIYFTEHKDSKNRYKTFPFCLFLLYLSFHLYSFSILPRSTNSNPIYYMVSRELNKIFFVTLFRNTLFSLAALKVQTNPSFN